MSKRVTVLAILGTRVLLKAMSLELPAVNDLVQKAKSVVGCSTTTQTFNAHNSPLNGFIGSLAGLEKFKNDRPQAGVRDLACSCFGFHCELCRAILT